MPFGYIIDLIVNLCDFSYNLIICLEDSAYREEIRIIWGEIDEALFQNRKIFQEAFEIQEI